MKYGEIVQLGRHRLMCGDATRPEDVSELVGSDRVNLVLTDPPYGVRSVNPKTGQIGGKSKIYMPVIGDTDTDMFAESYHILRRVTPYMIIWGGRTSHAFCRLHAGGFSGTSANRQTNSALATAN